MHPGRKTVSLRIAVRYTGWQHVEEWDGMFIPYPAQIPSLHGSMNLIKPKALKLLE